MGQAVPLVRFAPVAAATTRVGYTHQVRSRLRERGETDDGALGRGTTGARAEQNREYTCLQRRPVVRGPVAQWESTWFASTGLQVRILSGPPEADVAGLSWGVGK